MLRPASRHRWRLGFLRELGGDGLGAIRRVRGQELSILAIPDLPGQGPQISERV
jgi:hypothetical protein